MAGEEEEEETKISLDSLLQDNIQEIIGEEDIRQKVSEGKILSIYWGTAPTTSPHVAYFMPLLKLRQFFEDGHRVKILLADVHSFCDMGFDAYNRVEQRTQFYEHVITEMLKVISSDGWEEDVIFVRGSQYQLDKRYNIDLKKLESCVPLKEAMRASSDMVKNSKNPLMSSLVYPLMQCLDETYMEADIQLGGNDQRSIFALSRDHIEKIGYKKCTYLLNPLIPALDNKSYKMSSSRVNSKLCFTDSDEIIHRKISKSYCVEGSVDLGTSPLLSLLKYVVFPIAGKFYLEREEKWGGTKLYHTYKEVEEDWKNQSLSGVDLKNNLVHEVIRLVSPVRHFLETHPELYENAYGKVLE